MGVRMSKILTIDIGNTYIRVCELSYSGTDAKVHKVIQIKTPEGTVEEGLVKDTERVSQALAGAFKEAGILTKNTIFTLASTNIATKEVVTPYMNDKKLSSFISTNATDYFPVDVENYIVSYVILQELHVEDTKKLRVNVIAAPKQIVLSVMDLASSLGLFVKNIDYSGNSSLQVIKRQVDSAVSLVIEIRDSTTVINIIDNNVMVLQRIVPYGKNTVVSTLCEEKKIEEWEAVDLLKTERIIHSSYDGDVVTESLEYLTNNIVRVVDYYSSRNVERPVEKAYLTGASAEMLGVENLFANEFNFSIMQVMELNNVSIDSKLMISPYEISRYISCIGAGIAPAGFMLYEDTIKFKSNNTFKYLRIGLMTSVGVSALLVAVPFLGYLSAKTDKENVEVKIKEVISIEEVVDNYYSSKDILKDAIGYYALTADPNDALSTLIKDLEDKQPSDISINNFSTSSGSVNLSCTTSTKESVAKFIQQLESFGYVGNVFVSAITESKDADGVVTLNFTATFAYTLPADSILNILKNMTK